MAEKRYKITPAIVNSPHFQQAAQFTFRVGFQDMSRLPATVYCPASRCPNISVDGSTVIGTTNEWAQSMIEQFRIPPGPVVNGQPYLGTRGMPTFQTTTDPVTLDLDPIFDSVS